MTVQQPAQPPRWLEYMSLADLEGRRHPGNVKDHDQAGIAASMEEHGYTDPIEVDERTGRIVSGHGRVDQLLDAHATGRAAPDGVVVIHADGGVVEWAVPVVRGWESRDDQEAERYMATANRLTEAGGWQLPALADFLAREAASDRGFPAGFDQGYLDGLLADIQPPDFQPTGEQDQPRLDRRFLLICAQCGSTVDPAAAEKREA